MPRLKNNLSLLAWLPQNSNIILWTFLGGFFFEILTNKVILFFLKPTNPLSEISSQFKIITPIASFSIYFLEILSILLLFHFSIQILKIPWTSKISRLFLGLILYFLFPLFLITAFFITVRHMSTALWYYTELLILTFLVSLTIWLVNIKHKNTKLFLLWILLALPAVMFIIWKLVASFIPNGQTNHIRIEHYLRFINKFGMNLFMFQPLVWFFFIPKNIIKPNYFKIISSLLLTISIALLFYYKTAVTIDLWYLIFRITFPMTPFFIFIYYLALFSFIYNVISFLTYKHPWNFAIVIGLLTWIFTGYGFYEEEYIIPWVFAFMLLSIGISLFDITPKFSKIKLKDFKKTISSLFENVQITENKRNINVKIPNFENNSDLLIEADLFCGKINEIRCLVGTILEHDTDWIVTSLPLVPVTRYVFPSLLPIDLKNDENQPHITIWDRNFFSDAIIDQKLANLMNENLIGEIKVWWKSGVCLNLIYVPDSPDFLKKILDLIKTLSFKAGLE